MAIEKAAAAQLHNARQRLERHQVDLADTEFERGRIAALKWLLKLPAEKQSAG